MSLLAAARQTLPSHRVACYEVKYFVSDALRIYSNLGDHVTAAIEQLEFEAGPNYDKDGIKFSVKLFQAALHRRTSLLMLLEQYLEVFRPDWTDWSKVPNSWRARFALYPLSLFKTLRMYDNKEDYNFSYIFGNGKSKNLTSFWITFAGELRLPTKVVSKHLMSDLIMDYLGKIAKVENDVDAIFERVLNLVGASDNKRRGCIIMESANGVAIKSYYRWRGSKKTATVPMKIKMHRWIEYPKDKSGWNDLIESFYDLVLKKKKLPQRPFDEEADAKFWELREEYFSSKNKWYSHYLTDDDDSVVDVTDEMLLSREIDFQKKKDLAELIE